MTDRQAVAARDAPARPEAPTAGRPRSRWLAAARLLWAVMTVLLVGFAVASTPLYVEQAAALAGTTSGSAVSPAALRAGLQELGLSTGFYALYLTLFAVLFSLVYCAVGAILFWRAGHEPAPLLISSWLVIFGTTFTPLTIPLTRLLEQGHPLWGLLYGLVGSLGFASFFLLFYLFPDGRFVPGWTRWLALLFVAFFIVISIFDDTPLDPDTWPPVLGIPFYLAWLGAMIYAQVYRYRRVSTPMQRQQTKWVVFGLTAAIVGFFGAGAIDEIVPLLKAPGAAALLYDLAFGTTLFVGFSLVPVTIAVAVLRYRLYDIDLLINRALVYGALTGTLLAVYFGSVVVLQNLLRALTGQESNLAIVVATLAAAALFQPLRRHLQAGIDRRFYRRKYDAARTLAAFSARLQEEVELSRLTDELLTVVNETMRPAHVSLWLRRPERKP